MSAQPIEPTLTGANWVKPPVSIVLNWNDYEPDICFFRSEKAAGFTPNQSKFPAPDLIVEVLSESTETIEQYLLERDSYRLAVKVKTGTIASAVVTEFEIPVRAVFDGAEQLTALQAILAG